MTIGRLPSLEYLRQSLRYEPDTGHLYWLERPLWMFSSESSARSTNTRCAGKRAFTARGAGGLVGQVGQQKVSAHRVAFFMHYGEEPFGEIDHINGDPTDNRIENLRCVSHAENARNRARNRGSSDPAFGVKELRGRWQASIKIDGKMIFLGAYRTLDEAVAARQGAERVAGFHPNHGRAPIPL